MGTLSRNEMEQAINAGGSVLYGGRLYTRIADLPNDAELAAGDPERELAAANAMQAQMATLQAQMEELRAAQARRQSGTREKSSGALSEHPFVAIAGQETADRLIAAGYGTPEAVAQASDEDLRAIKGVGEATLKRLRETQQG
jgi:hypothetical protein